VWRGGAGAGYDLEEVPKPEQVSPLPVGVGRILRKAPKDAAFKVPPAPSFPSPLSQ
jgi:hypothetical protein